MESLDEEVHVGDGQEDGPRVTESLTKYRFTLGTAMKTGPG